MTLPSTQSLVFRSAGQKHYARTPTGEIAFGPVQGLYEWRYGVVIRWTGGDRQISSEGTMWTLSGRPEPNLAGLRLAILEAYRGGGTARPRH